MSGVAPAATGRELYVYWHLAAADVPVAGRAMAAFQHALRLQHEGLQARLLRRHDEHGHQATLMETYAMAGGLAEALHTQIVVEGATAAAPWCLGARQVEVFESIEP